MMRQRRRWQIFGARDPEDTPLLPVESRAGYGQKKAQLGGGGTVMLARLRDGGDERSAWDISQNYWSVQKLTPKVLESSVLAGSQQC